MRHIISSGIQMSIKLLIEEFHNCGKSLVNQWFYHSRSCLYSRLIRILIARLIDIEHLLLQSLHMIVFPQKIRFIPAFYHLQHFFSHFSRQFKLMHPRSDFRNQRFVLRIHQQDIGGFFHTFERILKSLEICLIVIIAFFERFQETFGSRLDIHRFFAAVSVSVRSQVGIVHCKTFKFFRCTWQNGTDRILPRLPCIILGRIPGITCHTINRYL